VNALTRLMSRFRRGVRPTSAGGCPTIERHRIAVLWPGTWLLFGLLLVGGAAPAYGFDDEERSPQIIHDLVLDSSGVPTSANWVVLDASGIAAWRAQGDSQWHRFTRGEVLPPGCEIETGSDGEITLVAGGDQLTIAPQGRLIVPTAQPGQDRRLRHERGRILMQIESREARDVRVDTPLLSLGIKGTTFEVLVEPEQDSVLVHEGDVEVTTPGQADAVNLGADEGLRQPAASGSEPTRFVLPAPEGSVGSADGPAWRLPAAETDGPGEPETHGPPAAPDPAEMRNAADRGTRGGSARGKPASSDAGIDFGRLDELASSWGSIAIAAVGLLILTIPALALLQHLREQWLGGRPRPKGQRRRQLVRG
jgi:FecR protein